MQKLFLFICFSILTVYHLCAQNLQQYNAAEILHQIQKLNTVGSVLYVAAHPDDENTIMLAWLAKDKMLKTTYLSLNRGDGGQNLIGAEQAEQLGLIRTHELLAARQIDGAEQYFTRANDFGFSKTTDETLKIWGEKEILGDVVYKIRQLQPDVIICRFPPDSRAGHGNHSASAFLAEKAFKLSNDALSYPEQLKEVGLWQAKRIVWNTFNFGASSQVPTEKNYLTVEIGGYNALIGKAYTELAAESRSQHRSQGFGVPRTRGSRKEYFIHKDGIVAKNDIFEDIDLTWHRLEGGAPIKNALDALIKNFDVTNPQKSLTELVTARKLIRSITNPFWKSQKLAEIDQIIKNVCGIWLEINPDQYQIAQGDPIKLSFSIISRSAQPIKLNKLQSTSLQIDTTYNNANLQNNQMLKIDFLRKVPENQPITEPYWMEKPKTEIGKYQYNFDKHKGEPMADASFTALVELSVLGENITYKIPVAYKYTDEVKGELYRPFEVKPAVSIIPQSKALIFNNLIPQTLIIKVKSFTSKFSGNLTLNLPDGWQSQPKQQSLIIDGKLEEQSFEFKIWPTEQAKNGLINALVTSNTGKVYTKEAKSINYDHIPALSFYNDAEIKVVKSDMKLAVKNIGYIKGAGDEVPAAINQMGGKISFISDQDLDKSLGQYEAIVVGVRGFNTNDLLFQKKANLMKYVENGGTLIVQYQVNSFLQKIDNSFGPYPMKISRDRVTVEEAEIKFLKPAHPLLNFPNKITNVDFEGWVQERGLYFSNEWDAKYDTILSSNDPNEKAADGGLLYTKYGNGHFIYTGYAFFRQLPAAVPGAYRLFANLLSIGKHQTSDTRKPTVVTKNKKK